MHLDGFGFALAGSILDSDSIKWYHNTTLITAQQPFRNNDSPFRPFHSAMKTPAFSCFVQIKSIRNEKTCPYSALHCVYWCFESDLQNWAKLDSPLTSLMNYTQGWFLSGLWLWLRVNRIKSGPLGLKSCGLWGMRSLMLDCNISINLGSLAGMDRI